MSDRIDKAVEMKASVDRVWRALTDHREFGQWFKVDIEGPFVAGQRSRGKFTNKGYEHIVWDVEVVAIEPQTRFAIRWHPYAIDSNVDYSDEPTTLIEFGLTPTAAGTRLAVSESGFDALPASRRGEALRMNTGGWEAQLQNIRLHVER